MKNGLMECEVSGNERSAHDLHPAMGSGPAHDQELGQLFQAYFNNKMTLLLFLIQGKAVKPNPGLVEGISLFLDDLYHHMLTGKNQERYRHAVEWLKSFFQTLPEASLEQRSRAKGFVRDLYDAMGMRLKAKI